MVSAPSRETLIKTLWPDKAMYGAIMIFVTGVTGILWGLVGALIDVSYADAVPRFLREVPPYLAILPSGAAMVLAYLALARHEVALAFAACAAGFLSFAGLGLGPILAAVAAVFVVLSQREHEFTSPATRALTAEMWPDKSLAASMLSLVTGVLTMFWGLLMLSNVVTWSGLSDARILFGSFDVVVGLLNLAAARGLYYQRGARLGMIGAMLGIVGFGFFLLGPILSAANVVLIRWAAQEKEFDTPPLRQPIVRTA